MKELIGYCGLDCEQCDARIATVNNDEDLRENTAELWSRLNGAEITPQMINCVGCRIEGVKTLFCNDICLIRKCAESNRLNRMKRQMPAFTLAIAGRIYDKMRRTSNLYVESTCISCGLCERKCPVKAIKIREGRPEWIKQQCTMCLGCLHRCPVFAIQYGRGKTRKHGQYINPYINM